MEDDNKTKKQLVHELTELRSQNAELKKSESVEKYRSLVENLRDVIYELDDQGVVLYISPVIRDLLGFDSSEIVGKKFVELAHKDDLNNFAQWFSELSKGIESPSEYRVLNKSGEIRWARTKSRPVMKDGLFKGARGILIDVTAQRRAEDALRESEELFRNYLENAPDAVYMSDMNGNLLYGNRKYEEIIGYRREELLGKNLLELNILPEKSLNKAAQLLKTSIEGKPTGPDEIDLIRKDGRLIPVEINTSVVQRMGQGIILAFVRDITEHKKAEERLFEKEQLLSESQRLGHIGSWFLDVKGQLSWSEEMYRLYGVSPDTFTPTVDSLLSLIHPDDQTLMQAWIEACASGKKPGELEFRIKRHDGTIRFIKGNGDALLDAENRLIHMAGTAQDITETKQAEAKLRQQTDAMDSAIDGIAILNEREEYVYVNKAHARLYGYENIGELIGKSWGILYDPDAVQHFEHEIMPELGRKGNWHGETIGTKKNESKFPQELSLTAMADGGLICVVRDITDRKRAEDTLKESENKYRMLADNVNDVIFVLDMNLNYTYISPSIKILIGYEPEELLGQSAIKTMTSSSWDLATKTMSGAIELEKFEHGEISTSRTAQLEMRRKDGTTVWAEVKASFIKDENQRTIGILGVTRDLTERKQAEEELRRSEERFRRIFDEGPFGMMLANSDYTIVMANKAFCGLLGYNEQELVGQSIADITCEEDRERSREFSGQLFAGSIPVLHLEKRYVRKDGKIVWTKITSSAIHGKEGNVLYGLAIIEDLTDSRKAADKIHLLAYYDSLTGLPNRTFHKELMERSIEHARRRKEIFALIYIGLDNFQRINDTLGHSFGDLLLKAVADRLTNSLRKSDYVARSSEGETVNVISRVGGDEFIAVAHDLNQAQDAAITSLRLLEEISAPYDLSGREVFMTASIGISLYPDDGTDVDDLLKNAEKAMRHTKSEGKNSYHFYSSTMHASALELLTMESDLHKALERDELMLYYQPKVDAATRMVKGMEALIRWKHPEKGLIPPIQFIPLAETSGLIIPIGEFVIRTVCGQIKTWQEAGYKHINIALNVSSRQFDQPNLMEIVKEALQDTLISPQCLDLEITESIIMRNPEKAIQILTELNTLGIGISIDDFGTGYSSLSYLKRLPLDFLKIDQSFVKGLASDPRDQAIIMAIIAMAHSLNFKTIAEGVETEEQLSFLQEHGCDEIQGYLFSRPLPAEEIPEILAKGYL